MAIKGRILVVDDELGIREGCRRVLVPEGYQVEVASGAAEGLRKIREGDYDLVLIDVMMPDGRGTDLLGPIREKDPDTVSLIITGYATVELAVEAVRQGAYDFISKPFSADVLRLAVDQALEKRRLSLEAKRVRELEREAAEMARQREEMERLDAIKSGFMLTVAHELRAPLTAIQSFLLAILKGYIPPEQQQQTLQRAIDRAQELLDLVDDLLRLAAVKREQEAEKRQLLSLDGSLEQVVELMRAQADSKRITLSVEVRARPQVEANPAQVTQIWTNLLSNALKYTPPGGRVRVTLEQEGRWAVGTVEDTGIGIAPEDQERIFEEFYRTPQAKELEPRGTGLGLPLVKRIVEGLGGRVQVRSQPGKGSRFAFRLPIAGQAPAPDDSGL
jgi:two-component system sensor histidine kinase/response regulator